MKLIEYKINKYGKKPFFGVILHDGRQWLSLKYNITDYELMGRDTCRLRKEITHRSFGSIEKMPAFFFPFMKI